MITGSNGQDDKVVYAAPAQTATIPHQAAASGEQYAVSTKAANKTSEEQPPTRQYDTTHHDTKKDTQGVSKGVLVAVVVVYNRTVKLCYSNRTVIVVTTPLPTQRI